MSKGNILTYFTILEKRKKKSGLYPVCLVVYFNGARRRYRTSVDLDEDQWKKIKSPKLRDEDLKTKRAEIQSFVRKAENAGKKLAEWSIKTTLMYETILTTVGNFSPKLRMRGITPDFLRQYEKHLASENKSISAIGIYLLQIRIKWALPIVSACLMGIPALPAYPGHWLITSVTWSIISFGFFIFMRSASSNRSLRVIPERLLLMES